MKFIIILTFLFSCASPQIISTGDARRSDGSLKKFSKVKLESVKIYRTKKINEKKFYNLGIITFEGEGPQISYIYQKLRKTAARSGAHYITGRKVKVKKIQKAQQSQSCTTGTNGVQSCTNTTTYITVLKYIASGDLFRRK